MARSGTREYRGITQAVLRWYLELDSVGFDATISNYKVDVGIALDQLGEIERAVLLSIHRDGLTAADACRIGGVPHSRPDEYATAVEVKLGRELRRRKLEDLVEYLAK